MFGLLNVASLGLGLIAWILPVVNLMHQDKLNNRHWAALSIMSLSACAVSLVCQIYYNYYLVKIEDWSALMDTTRAVVIASTVLFVVTILLNIMTLIVYRYKTTK